MQIPEESLIAFKRNKGFEENTLFRLKVGLMLVETVNQQRKNGALAEWLV